MLGVILDLADVAEQSITFRPKKGRDALGAIMAEVNGISKHEDTVSVSTTHLGKRKRTLSPEPSTPPENEKISSLQNTLQQLLQQLRK